MKNIVTLTLLYISAPTYLFLYFWVKPGYAFLAISLIALTFSSILYNLYYKNNSVDESKEVPVNTIITSILIAFGLCFFSEFGIYKYQSYDYLAHNYKFNLLTNTPLPLFDQEKGIYMCYYLGYYIIPSLLGSLTKLSLVKYFAFLWTWIGLTISYIWIQTTLSRFSLRGRIAICLLFTVGTYVCTIIPLIYEFIIQSENFKANSININNSFLYGQVSILSRGLSAAPQHILPILLSFSFYLAIIKHLKFFYSYTFFLFCTLFWTPFAGIGMFVFYLYFVFCKIKEGKLFFLSRFIPYGVLLFISFSPVILYFISSSASSLSSNRFVWQSASNYWLMYYLLYIFTFLGVWFIFFNKYFFESNKVIIILSVISFSLLGLGQIGYYNDFNLRSSAPSQLFLGFAISYGIVVNYKKLLFRSLLFTFGVLFFVLNTASFFKFHFDRLFILEHSQNSIEQPKVPWADDNFYSVMEKGFLFGEDAVRQYSLKESGIFEKYLLKKSDGLLKPE